MATWIDKVQGKLHKRSTSGANNPRLPNQVAVTDSLPPKRDVNKLNTTTVEPSSRVSSPTLPAWHVHKGNRNSTATSQRPTSSLTSSDQYNSNLLGANDVSRLSENQHYTSEDISNMASVRDASSQQYEPSTGHIYTDDATTNPLPYPYTVPRRKESLPQHRLSRKIGHERSVSDHSRGFDQESAHSRQEDVDHKLPDPSTSGSFGRDINQALAGLTMDEPGTGAQHGNVRHSNSQYVSSRDAAHPAAVSYEPQTSQMDGESVNRQQIASNGSAQASEHIRLPKNFNMGQSEHTIIDTMWKPAVVHENIHHEKTEIIREAITRDIHIHHYYTYVQPIKVVEVLPAKHYRIDEKTGYKIEIPAPAGWQMPKDLEPRTGDTSNLKGWTRHYLVNEQYPNGIAEPAPEFNGANSQSRQNRLY